MRKSYFVAGLFLFAAIVLVSALWILSERSISEIQVQGTGLHVYKRHYMMISDDHSQQWEAIFAAAQEAARETDAAVEWTGQGLAASYGAAECMEIAVAAKPDGIILYQRSGEDLTELIEEASQRQIPVITLLNDSASSRRISYIGLNSYQMGEIYGEEVLRVLDGADGNVLVLLSQSGEGESEGLLYTQMLRRAEQGKAPGQEIRFSTYGINTASSFDAEEDIRDIFVSGGELPEVMICLDPVSTECVKSALVDYNQVGNLSIIGYYASESTLEAVEKGLVTSTLNVDARQIGRLGIEALNEYCESGHVSSYFNVGIEMITQENVESYRKTYGIDRGTGEEDGREKEREKGREEENEEEKAPFAQGGAA